MSMIRKFKGKSKQLTTRVDSVPFRLPLSKQVGSGTKSQPQESRTMFAKLIEAHRLMFNIEATLNQMRAVIDGEGEAKECLEGDANSTMNSGMCNLVDRLAVFNEKLFRLSKSHWQAPRTGN